MLCRPSPSRGRLPCGDWTSSVRCRRRPGASPTCWWQSTNSPSGSRLDPSARSNPSKPFILHRHRLQVRGPELDHHRQRHPVHRQEILGILRQLSHMRGLVSCGAPTDEWASGACQWHDPPRTEAKDLQQAKQIWPEVAHRATLGYLDPEDDPKQSHGLCLGSSSGSR